MGCTASKLDNEDTVRRSKQRRRLIKDAVFARHHLAAAHADYCRSLRLTGSALSDFSSGEPLLVSPQTPSVLLPSSAASVLPVPPFPAPSTVYGSYRRPPPPPKSYSAAAESEAELSPTIASSKLPHILSASSRPPTIKTKKQVKIPHILSDSSVSSTPMSYSGAGGKFNFPTAEAEATHEYATTPSQASSVWNWENFYPPSPPDSEYFNPNRKNDAILEEEREREEVHCSEWGDHYSTTSSDTEDDVEVNDYVDGDDERESRSGVSRSNFDSSSVRSEPGRGAAAGVKMMGKVEEDEDEAGSRVSSMRWKNGKEVCGSEDMRIVVRHKDFKEIVGSLQDYFDKAASAGDQVSEMLETGRAQLDRSFRQLKSMAHFIPSFNCVIDLLILVVYACVMIDWFGKGVFIYLI